MARWTISQVARQVALRPSAIRYYERIGVLPTPERSSGRRRYDDSALYRLALVQHARATGFSLGEIKRLFFGFPATMPISKRWRKLAEKKLVELEAQVRRIESMQAVLRRLQTCCHCSDVEECGKAMLESVTSSTCSASPRRLPEPEADPGHSPVARAGRRTPTSSTPRSRRP
jgi:MerR family redox-sensitive transcriptional activator SoxR